MTNILPAIERISARRFAAALLAGAVLVNLPGVLLGTPGNDASTYYLRMAAAFADGRWAAAFFHKIPPLYPVLVGIVAALTGLGEYVAAKIVGVGCFIGGLFFTWGLAARLFDERTARWAALLYLFSPRLIRYATNAGPDLPKVFFLLGLAWFAVRYIERRRLADGLIGALFAVAATFTRSECVAFGSLYVALPALVPGLRWGWAAAGGERGPAAPGAHDLRRGIVHSAALGLVCLALFQPWMWYEYRHTGWWVLDSRYVRFLVRAGVAPEEELKRFNPDQFEGVRRNPERHRFGPLRPVWETVKGFGRAYFVLALVGLWRRWRDRRLSWLSDGLPAGVVLLNAFLFYVCFGYVTKRYIAPSQPFILGWASAGLMMVASALGRVRRGDVLVRTAVAALFAVGAWDGWSQARPSLSKEKRLREALPLEVGRWIRENRALSARWKKRPPPEPCLWMYRNLRRPVIASAYPQVSWAADGDWMPICSKFLCTPEGLMRMCRESDADLLLWSPRAEEFVKGLHDYIQNVLRLRPIQTWQVGGQVWELYELPHGPELDARLPGRGVSVSPGGSAQGGEPNRGSAARRDSPHRQE